LEKEKLLMSNSIVVYWASLEDEWMRAVEPFPIYKDFAKKEKCISSKIEFCPSFKKYLNNYFGLKSIYDYEFEINENDFIVSNKFDQAFYEKHVEVRSIDHKSFSFRQELIFFTEEKSLELSVGINPFLEDNNITERCNIIPGTLDIGKWFRAIDFAFFLKNNYNSFKIKEDEVYSYINFNTDKKIIFKQFLPNDYLNRNIQNVLYSKFYRRQKIRGLEEYYSMFKNKKNIIKEIKNNLI
jgi:hypothetical protein